MSLAQVVLGLMWCGLTAYALTGGADFGGGVWDLVAGGPQRGAAQRELIAHSIGPVWEANHVWLIFVLVVLWTGFPTVFAAVMSTLYIPLTLAALGIIARGSAFAFRSSATELVWRRFYGATFAGASVLTPFCLGTVAGAVASGRVPPGNARGEAFGSWLNPTSLLGGVLAVGVCAYLAAVYLSGDAVRDEAPHLAEGFRSRAIGAGIAVGVIAAGGVLVLRADAPRLYDGLVGRALPLIVLSAVGGLASLVLLWQRHLMWARLAAATAVGAVVWGWGVGQYPNLLEPAVSIDDAAASPAALRPLLVALVVAVVLVVPSLALLYRIFQSPEPDPGHLPPAP